MSNNRNTITVPIYTNRDQIDVTFPARLIICQACDGHATTTSHIEADGGGYTGEEWAEACRDVEDFPKKYFGGFYDRPCPTCAGKGRVQAIDEDRVTGWRYRIFLKAIKAQERDNRAIDAMQAAERRMGA